MPRSKRTTPQSKYSKKKAKRQRHSYGVLEPRNLLAGAVTLATTDGVWSALPDSSVADPGDQLHVSAVEQEFFQLNQSQLAAQLANAPLEFTRDAALNPVYVQLPTPDNSAQTFAVVESPIMELGLAAKFPGIKTYSGFATEDPSVRVRFDLSPLGFNATVVSPESGDYIISPYAHLDTDVYTSYFRSDAVHDVSDFEFGVEQIAETGGVRSVSVL